MKVLFFIILIISSIIADGQNNDSIQQKENAHLNSRIFIYKRNYKEDNFITSLCGRGGSGLMVGYSFDKYNWVELGYQSFSDFAYSRKRYKSISLITRFDNEQIYGLKLSYYQNTFSSLTFPTEFGINVETYTNKFAKDYGFVVRPEISISVLRGQYLQNFYFSYGYNIMLFKNALMIEERKHQISIKYVIPIKHWVS